jgi:PKD domain
MRARLAAVPLAVVLLLATAAGAQAAKTTTGFKFASNGSAVLEGAVQGTGAAGTYEDFPFTIASDEQDGDISVSINWTNPFDDWDLYVYRKVGAQLETVGSSTGGPPSTQENAVTNSQGVPITPGHYVIRVQNYAATNPNGFTGFAKFGQFVPYNQIPIAKLRAPAKVKQGKAVRLDASASHDPDGTIKNYSFDLDGNGSMEVNNGTNPILKRVLKPGTHHVAVRVTDDKGLRAYATRTVVVTKKKGKKK